MKLGMACLANLLVTEDKDLSEYIITKLCFYELAF
jgi:hypothetical protein